MIMKRTEARRKNKWKQLRDTDGKMLTSAILQPLFNVSSHITIHITGLCPPLLMMNVLHDRIHSFFSNPDLSAYVNMVDIFLIAMGAYQSLIITNR
jgi:hypothetical protein